MSTITLPQGFICIMELNDLSFPIPLEKADLSKDFIYWRQYGVFYCGSSHPCALSAFLDWKKKPIEVPDMPYYTWFGIDHNGKYRDVSENADIFLTTTPGTCYRSSVARDKIIAGYRGALTRHELFHFKNVDYLQSEMSRL